MPPVVAAISAFAAAVATEVGIDVAVAVGSGLAGEIAGALTYSAIEVGIYAGISIGVGLLTAPKVPDPAALQTPLKQSMPVRQSAFGRVRVSGAYALFAAGSGGSKTVAHQVLALLDGRSHQVVNYYLNDDLMAENGGGYWYAPGAYGKYGQGDGAGNLVQIDSRIGNTPEVPYAISGSLPLWDSSHRGDGVTSMVVVCKQAHKEDQAACFPNGVPSPSAAIDAQLIYDPRDPGQNQGDPSTYTFSDNPALCLLAYLTDASGGVGLDYARFIAPTIDYWKAVADECDGLVSTSGMHATLAEASAAGDNTLTLNDLTGLSAGVVISLPTEDVTVSSISGPVVTLTGDLTYAHSAGELAYWSGSGQQALYRCAGTYRHDNAPGDVIKSILSSFDGWLGARGDGALVPRTNTLSTPSVVLTDRHVVGYQAQHYLPDEQAVNQLIVSYTDPAAAFNKAEAGYVQDDADIAARGTVRSQQLPLDWVPSAPQAMTVANAVLARSTQPLRGTLTCNFAGLAVLGERYVQLQLSELPELNDLTVEVTGKPTIDLAAMTVSFPWIAAVATEIVVPPLEVVGANLAIDAAAQSGSITLPSDIPAGYHVVAFCTGTPAVSSGWTEIMAVHHDPQVLFPGSRGAWRYFPSGAPATVSPFGGGVTSLGAWAVGGLDPIFTPSLHYAALDPEVFGGSSVTLTDSAPTEGLYLFMGVAVTLSGNPGIASHSNLTDFSIDTEVHGSPNGPGGLVLHASYASTPGAPVTETVSWAAGHPVAGFMIGFNNSFGTPVTYPLSPPGSPSGGTLDPLTAPTITSVTPEYPDSGGGVAGARLSIVVGDPGLDNLGWRVQWKLSSDTVWASAGDSLTASSFTLLTGLIAASGSVDVQVAYFTANQTSPWSATTTVTVAAPVANTATGTASAALAANDLVNIYSGGVRKADASAGYPAHGFVDAAVSSGATATVLFGGTISGLSSLTKGPVYLSATAGALTNTPPSGSGQIVQQVGVATSATTVDFEALEEITLR